MGLTPFRGGGPVFTPGFCSECIVRLRSLKQVTGLRERAWKRRYSVRAHSGLTSLVLSFVTWMEQYQAHYEEAAAKAPGMINPFLPCWESV